MATGHLTQNAIVDSNILTFGYPRREANGGRDRTQHSLEAQLRDAITKVRALQRRLDQMVPQPKPAAIEAWISREDATHRLATLTRRQHQIMELVLAGHPSKNIAADLNISQRTTENHRARIMRKTGTKSLPALTRLAVAAGMYDVSDSIAES